ncbi:MAG: hypothetical protein GQ535_16065 [Rhodobacteraceae bacterium]|nr:hypothetical protein [Paracoccaceae bacterium]
MKVTTAALALLQTGFQTSFRGGLAQAPTQYQRISTVIPSSNKSETYGWLGKLPNVREWVGDRGIQNLKDHSYQVLNKDWELTIGVDRNDIEDDAVGQYGPVTL